jgi:hypothetical protein
MPGGLGPVPARAFSPTSPVISESGWDVHSTCAGSLLLFARDPPCWVPAPTAWTTELASAEPARRVYHYHMSASAVTTRRPGAWIRASGFQPSYHVETLLFDAQAKGKLVRGGAPVASRCGRADAQRVAQYTEIDNIAGVEE